MPDIEAVQRTDCDTKGDIAKVKELSLKANRAVSFSSEDAWVKSLGIPLHTTYKYALLSWTEIEKATYPCDLELLRCVFTLIKNGEDFNNVTLI